MAAKAFTGQIKLLLQMKHLITTRRTLVEAANASSYGWMAAKHMESGHGIFSLEDKDLMKSLREAEMVVRRDTREFKAHRGNSSNRGRGIGVRKNWWDNSNKTLEHIGQALWEWSNKHMKGAAQGVFNKYNKSGKVLSALGVTTPPIWWHSAQRSSCICFLFFVPVYFSVSATVCCFACSPLV